MVRSRGRARRAACQPKGSDIFEEITMTQPRNVRHVSSTPGLAIAQPVLQPDYAGTPHRATLFLMLISIVTVILLGAPRPGFSQAALVQVDVTVVAKGHRASKLIGSSVSNEQNEKIGTLDDIIVDQKSVLFGILQVGGFLGIGARLVAVPYQSLVVSEDGKKIELPGATRDELKKLAEFKYRD
jgi:sporulation protein YlmC with PRC-barrel domain